MPVQLTDSDISRLVAEPKPLRADYQARIATKPKRGHSERELDVTGANGSQFRLILRQSLFNAFDFSVILAYCAPSTNQIFRLRLYNGRSHEHTNPLEGETFYSFHIHLATERYQELGLREDTYAQQSARFAAFHDAVRCMFSDCAFEVPVSAQGNLFGEE